MRTISTSIILTVIVSASFLDPSIATAQGDLAAIKQDRVMADLSTVASVNEAITFQRTVTLSNEGKYNVVVTNAQGDLRMTGSYSDSELTKGEGIFTYYYDNGHVESRGMFANGSKTGLWERFHPDGLAKPEKIYGPSWDDIAGEFAGTTFSGTSEN